MNDKNIKIGDVVTQSEIFYKYWNAPKVKRKVIDIIIKDYFGRPSTIIYLDKEIAGFRSGSNLTYENGAVNLRGTGPIGKSFNIDYLKLDLSETRKIKLEKLNGRI